MTDSIRAALAELVDCLGDIYSLDLTRLALAMHSARAALAAPPAAPSEPTEAELRDTLKSLRTDNARRDAHPAEPSVLSDDQIDAMWRATCDADKSTQTRYFVRAFARAIIAADQALRGKA